MGQLNFGSGGKTDESTTNLDNSNISASGSNSNAIRLQKGSKFGSSEWRIGKGATVMFGMAPPTTTLQSGRGIDGSISDAISPGSEDGLPDINPWLLAVVVAAAVFFFVRK